MTNISSLLQGILPLTRDVLFDEPNEVLAAYAGVGMPSLRIGEVPYGPGEVSYHRVKAACALRILVDPSMLKARYETLRSDALANDADALNDLGWLWLNGRGMPADAALARRLFKLAWAEGACEAAFNLAELAWYGKDGRVDIPLAIDHYQQAHAGGIICAARSLGRLYEEGDEGVPADPIQAAHWYRLGAGQQDDEAELSLGCLLLDDTSAVFNLPEALYWLQCVAMKGSIIAAEHLADLYITAFKSPPDPDGLLHVFWRDHAIRLGSSWARDRASEVS